MSRATPANSNKPCPICGQPPQEKYKPFCSARCSDVDLHRWLGGVYRVETDEADDGMSGNGPQSEGM